ncbi:Tagatose-6-phosphate kinase [Entamoeba marina]
MSVLVVCLNPVIQKTMVFDDFNIGNVNRAVQSFLVCKWKRFCTTAIASNISTELVEEGITIEGSEVDIIITSFTEALKTTSYEIVVFTGSTAPGIPVDCYRKLMLIAKQYNCCIVADVRGNVLKEMLNERPNVIKPNIHEFKQTFGDDVDENAFNISKHGTIVILTQGDKPTIVYENGKKILIEVQKINHIKNVIGCGDAFTAGFVSGLLQKKSLQESIEIGHSSATRNAETILPGDIIDK